MLCINSYTQEYIDECRSRVDLQVATYQNLIATAQKQAAPNDKSLNAAIDSFEPVFFNNLVLLLDQLFVHRSRMLELKDGNPLNEVRVLCNSLLNNQSHLIADKGIKLDPGKSILKLQVGSEIRLNEADFVQLAKAFFAEMEIKFLETEGVPA